MEAQVYAAQPMKQRARDNVNVLAGKEKHNGSTQCTENLLQLSYEPKN